MVIGSNPEESRLLARLLDEYLGIEVDALTLNRRSLDVVSRRELGIVILDLHVSDSIAVLNELGRRLAMARRRGVAAVVCHSAGHTGPAIERLAAVSGATRVLRPYDAGSLIAAVIESASTGVAYTAAG